MTKKKKQDKAEHQDIFEREARIRLEKRKIKKLKK